jgi:hypothetical protein
VSGWHGTPAKHHDITARELPHAAVDRPHTQQQREAHAQLQQRIAEGSDLGSDPSVTTHRISRYVLLVESYEVLPSGTGDGTEQDTAAIQAANQYAQDKVQSLARRMAQSNGQGTGSRSLKVCY